MWVPCTAVLAAGAKSRATKSTVGLSRSRREHKCKGIGSLEQTTCKAPKKAFTSKKSRWCITMIIISHSTNKNACTTQHVVMIVINIAGATVTSSSADDVVVSLLRPLCRRRRRRYASARPLPIAVCNVCSSSYCSRHHQLPRRARGPRGEEPPFWVPH